MPSAETTAPVRARTAGPVERSAGIERATVHGWGGGPGAPVALARPLEEDVAGVLGQARASGSGAIARGLGRSYGDAAQLTGGTVIESSALRRFELDRDRGTVTAQAGVTLMEL